MSAPPVQSPLSMLLAKSLAAYDEKIAAGSSAEDATAAADETANAGLDSVAETITAHKTITANDEGIASNTRTAKRRSR